MAGEGGEDYPEARQEPSMQRSGVGLKHPFFAGQADGAYVQAPFRHLGN